MAIQPIQILSPRVQAPGDFLGGASNMLSAQLNNAVQLASQMTDLQASQEGDFLQERERLYLNRERRGLETRRRMESDRAFSQDERQFSAQLGMQNRKLALDELRIKSGIDVDRARLGLEEQRIGLEEQRIESEETRAQNVETRAQGAETRAQTRFDLDIEAMERNLGRPGEVINLIDSTAARRRMRDLPEQWDQFLPPGVARGIRAEAGNVNDRLLGVTPDEIIAVYPGLTDEGRLFADELLMGREASVLQSKTRAKIPNAASVNLNGGAPPVSPGSGLLGTGTEDEDPDPFRGLLKQ